MQQPYTRFNKLFAFTFILFLIITSCKKDDTQSPPDVSYATLGLYQQQLDEVNHRLLIHITQLGNQPVDDFSIFDTGSTGLVLDATGILPDSLFNDNGIIIPGDSLVYNGITVTVIKDK